ncbi:MAG: hypothetical protein HY682_12055 [Chloroflexi bacterium]|nr:hypothetical protein [Chloroflexota bacterium]
MIGTLFGVVPGAIMVLLTGPVRGEAELTLAALGIAVGLIGALAGGIVGASRSTA